MKKTILNITLTFCLVSFTMLSCKKTYDCPTLSLNFADPCMTASGQNGKVDSNCNCIVSATGGGTTNYDCPSIFKNYGDICTKNGQSGKIDSTCNCSVSSSGGGSTKYDCPSIFKNYGDSCLRTNGTYGIIDSLCTCR